MRMLAAAVAAVLLLAACAASPETEPSPRPEPSATSEPPATSEPVTPSADPSPACDAPCYGSPETIGSLAADTVVEVSGMAASRRNPGLYYVVSDEAGTSEVVAVHEDGTPVARIELAGMDAENAEALAVGPCGSWAEESCVFVGDIGDHVGRPDVVVFRTPEPDLTGPPAGAVGTDELRYTYPDAPTDAEALLVDDTGRPMIVTKAPFDRGTGETGTTRLYRGQADGGELELLGEIDLPAPEQGLMASFVGNVVTDASAAGGMVLLRTYDEVLEYRAVGGTDPDGIAGFPRWPVRRVPAPNQVQSETVSYRVDGCGYLTTSELTGAVDAVACDQTVP